MGSTPFDPWDGFQDCAVGCNNSVGSALHGRVKCTQLANLDGDGLYCTCSFMEALIVGNTCSVWTTLTYIYVFCLVLLAVFSIGGVFRCLLYFVSSTNCNKLDANWVTRTTWIISHSIVPVYTIWSFIALITLQALQESTQLLLLVLVNRLPNLPVVALLGSWDSALRTSSHDTVRKKRTNRGNVWVALECLTLIIAIFTAITKPMSHVAWYHVGQYTTMLVPVGQLIAIRSLKLPNQIQHVDYLHQLSNRLKGYCCQLTMAYTAHVAAWSLLVRVDVTVWFNAENQWGYYVHSLALLTTIASACSINYIALSCDMEMNLCTMSLIQQNKRSYYRHSMESTSKRKKRFRDENEGRMKSQRDTKKSSRSKERKKNRAQDPVVREHTSMFSQHGGCRSLTGSLCGIEEHIVTVC